MIHLLDVNVLIAMLDARHVHHSRVHGWLEEQKRPFRWATCPITENAFVRIVSNATYPNSLGSAEFALGALRKSCSEQQHHFWPDDITIRDAGLWHNETNLTPGQMTDCYLLALAVKHGGKLVSLDRRLSPFPIRMGNDALLVLR